MITRTEFDLIRKKLSMLIGVSYALSKALYLDSALIYADVADLIESILYELHDIIFTAEERLEPNTVE